MQKPNHLPPCPIFNYHPQTLEYLSKGLPDKNPQGEGWLYPAFCTTIAPPIFKEKQAAIFDALTNTWSITPDCRGETWFKDDGEAIVVAALGDPSMQGLLKDQPPEPDMPIIYPALTARQIRLLLRNLNKLNLVEDLISAMAMPQKEDAQIEWEYGTNFEYQHFLVQHILAGLNIDVDEFNQLWQKFSIV